MSEEKLYVVKNDEGQYFDIDLPPWWDDKAGIAFKRIDLALGWAKKYGGHVVTLIEEPEKVVLTKEQAEIVEGAHYDKYPATYIYDSNEKDEELLMNAYVNGFTVEEEKKYVLPIPETDYHNNQMHGNAKYYAVKGTGNWRPDAIALGTDDAVKHGYTVTKSDIDSAPDWVKTITPVEVTDDAD